MKITKLIELHNTCNKLFGTALLMSDIDRMFSKKPTIDEKIKKLETLISEFASNN